MLWPRLCLMAEDLYLASFLKCCSGSRNSIASVCQSLGLHKVSKLVLLHVLVCAYVCACCGEWGCTHHSFKTGSVNCACYCVIAAAVIALLRFSCIIAIKLNLTIRC